ncbi:cytochrome-c peroxidase [Sulfurimonas sp. SAG-AH-194-C21]|nr:cytochrome-c peroxidase [Sulfurimonas sp. SAG-AH-194-C21]MDF1884045.1 cytochrome-c peroxidase [Sulfurimonas sp. SAG-AH-194-C21]
MKHPIFYIFFTLSLLAKEPITPIIPYIDLNIPKVELGKKLFFDARLSRDNTIACASCHIIEEGGDDNLKFSFGIGGQEGNINSPTVLNAVNNFRQFWDGRAKNLHEQIAGPIENPVEMGFNFPDLIIKLNKTEYKLQFSEIYSEGITKDTISDAIVEYEKTLLTLNAPFDRYLQGDRSALTTKEVQGYELFKSKGCISCHHGTNIGGNLYSKFGVVDSASIEHLGRFNVTKKERDKYFFKVPSLRNIARTAPYFHDGRTSDLKKAIEIMAQLQLGRFFTKEDIDKIEAFLRSLNGELPEGGNIYVP